MAWWREARFGMFVHFGLYSLLGGEWGGRTEQLDPDAMARMAADAQGQSAEWLPLECGLEARNHRCSPHSPPAR